jgi:integrase
MTTAKTSKGARRRPVVLTPRYIASMKANDWSADAGPRGAGALQVRKLDNGAAAFYFRYTGPDRASVRLPIGAGITLANARKEAGRLSLRYQSGDRDLRAAIETERRETERQRLDADAAAAADAACQRATLGALLDAYVEHLRRDGKVSARSVERTLHNHVRDACPQLWGTPAANVTTDDLLPALSQLVTAGKPREAAKLRAYLAAAFTAGIRARQDARSTESLRQLRIASNPAHDLATIEGAANARERSLSLAELRAYWGHVAAMTDATGAALQFHLLTGGQRVVQLGRVELADYDEDTATIRLLDRKGRRKKAREHFVPIIPAAAAAMKVMEGGALGHYVVTTTRGVSGISYESLKERMMAVANAMEEAGQLEGVAFTAGDLRRTVETRLAAAGVSKDIRAQLQSHGLGGVQGRHYDRHDYLAEKRAALETLYRLATGAEATVSHITRKAI